MHLYAAIDLRAGRSVRLVQGDFARERVYGDPVATADELMDGGAERLHVVDLDAARTGEPVNQELVAAIAANATSREVFVQVGGGIRDAGRASALLDLGASRVVLGTAALESPGLVRRLARRFPGRVAVGLDHRRTVGAMAERPTEATEPAVSLVNAQVASRGWTRSSAECLLDVLARFEDAGVAAVVVTDIGRDGMLSGPDGEGLAAVLDASALPVIASGGVSCAADLASLAALERSGRRLEGVIVGTALREGRLSVVEALQACAASG